MNRKVDRVHPHKLSINVITFLDPIRVGKTSTPSNSRQLLLTPSLVSRMSSRNDGQEPLATDGFRPLGTRRTPGELRSHPPPPSVGPCPVSRKRTDGPSVGGR